MPVSASDSVTLKDGTTLEIVDVQSGSTMEFDGRSTLEKLRSRLPVAVRAVLPGKTAGSRISFTGSDSLGIATLYPSISPAFNNTYQAILSDDSGWYSHADSMCITNNLFAYLFSLTPRSSKSIKFSLYGAFLSPDQNRKMGQINLINPRYDARFSSMPSTPVPNQIGTSGFKFDQVKMITGLQLNDYELRLPQMSFKHNVVKDFTTSVIKLLDNDVTAAAQPEIAWTALVFHIAESPVPANRIRNMSIAVTDSKGSSYYFGPPCFIQTEGMCAVASPKFLPVNDSNYTFEITVYEVPPLDSTSWKSMNAIVPGHNDDSSTKSLNFGTGEITAGMPGSYDRIDFSTTINMSYVAIAIATEGTTQTLDIPPPLYNSWQKPYWCHAPLPAPVTSGTVTLSFAETIQHKFTFTGTPETAK